MKTPHPSFPISVRLAPAWHQYNHLSVFASALRPNPRRPFTISGLFSLKRSKSVRTLIMAEQSSLICLADGASGPTRAPRVLLKHHTGSPSLIIHKECRKSFLFFATLFISFRMDRSFLRSSMLGMRSLALASSFSTRCVTRRSFVRTDPELGLKFQASQLNRSKTTCSKENRIASFPRAFSYGPSSRSSASSCRCIIASAMASLPLSLLTDVILLQRRHSIVSRKKTRWENRYPLIKSQWIKRCRLLAL